MTHSRKYENMRRKLGVKKSGTKPGSLISAYHHKVGMTPFISKAPEMLRSVARSLPQRVRSGVATGINQGIGLAQRGVSGAVKGLWHKKHKKNDGADNEDDNDEDDMQKRHKKHKMCAKKHKHTAACM